MPTPLGRTFREFLLHLPSVLLTRNLKGVHLQILLDLTPGTVCATPRCTCHTKHESGDRLLSKARISLKGRRKTIMMPQYVKFSSMTLESARKDAEAWASDPLSIRPRYAFFNESERPGLNLRMHFPQCKTARQVPLVYASLDMALQAVRSCLSALVACYEDYWGDVGIQPELAAMMSSMAECFWSTSSVRSF